MEYPGGTWTNNGFGDRGWLSDRTGYLCIVETDQCNLGFLLFGGLYILYLYIPGLGRSIQEIFKMLPYLVKIIVLIITSFEKETREPATGKSGTGLLQGGPLSTETEELKT